MNKTRYDTVREINYAPEDIEQISDYLQSNGQPCHLSHLMPSGADPIRLAQVKDIIETGVNGRKYEILLLRSQGKTYTEIALMLAISKSAVQTHYRRAIRQVREAMGFVESAQNGQAKKEK